MRRIYIFRNSFKMLSSFNARLRNLAANQGRPLAFQAFRSFSTAVEEIPLHGTEFVEIYTSNAKQSAHWYQTVMGFEPVAYRGLETGDQEQTSYLLKQQDIHILLTSPLHKGSEIGQHISDHGDGVKRVALRAENARTAYETAISRGAESAFAPITLKDEHGEVTYSAVKVYGNTELLFMDKSKYNGVFMPGFKEHKSLLSKAKYPGVGLKFIDHMVANLDWGKMNPWCDWYKQVLGFRNLVSFDDNDISTEYTALQSKVMANKSGSVKFPLNEPATGKKRSQIEEFLNFYHGEGIQHIAVATDDIIRTVAELRARGCELLTIPDSYYNNIEDRIGKINEDLEVLKKLNILIDRDDQGYLLQIFTKPVCDRPTVFFEIIQRCGAESFGKGNFKALFVSIEEEQKLRGTL